MKKISFIILSWNSEKYLQNCIESILKIKELETEIIIIDNGSTDNSIKIIEKYKKAKLIKLEKNYGTTISRNKGLHEIKDTDYICILDSDTVINEESIVIMTEYVEKHMDVGIVGPSMIGKDNQKQIPFRKFPTKQIKLYKALPIAKFNKIGESLESYDLNNITDEFECDYLISACWVMRYDVYKKLGDLDEKIFYAPEDVEYCMRARNKGYKVIHLKRAQITHFYQRISKKKLLSKANITHLSGLFYVWRKYRKFLRNYNKERK